MASDLPSEYLYASRELFDRIGGTTSIFFYGINVCLFIQLVTICRETKHRWTNVATGSTFILTSLFQSLVSYVTGMSSVCPNFETPDGSAIWFGNDHSRIIQLVIVSVALLNAWILDSCMLYQCFLVYSIRKIRLWIVGFALVFLLSSIGSGAYLIVTSWDMRIQVLPHFPLCLMTKLVVTSLIASKLLKQRRAMQHIEIENKNELIGPYTSLVRALVGSYALYSTFSTLFMGLNLSNVGAWRIFMLNTVQAGLASHLLVRLQVVKNRHENHHDKPYDTEAIRFSTTKSTSSQEGGQECSFSSS